MRSDIPYHVYGHAAATFEGKIHLLGGCHTEDWQVPTAHHQVYDPVRDKWETKAEVPLASAWGMPAVFKGKIYLFGGGYYRPDKGMTSSDLAWAFDPVTGKWTSIRNLPEPRMNGFAAAAGDYIYISLGYNRQGGGKSEIEEEYRSTYRYDPATDTYTRVADAPVTGCYVASGPYEGKVYAVPGSYHEYGFHGDYHWADGALEYDPATNQWEEIRAPRVKKRVFFLTQCSASVVGNGELWVVGGMAENRTRTVTTEYFDIEKRVFVRGPDIPFGRCCGGGGLVDGLLVVLGGFVDGAGLGTPALPTWTLDTSHEK